jgi:hypothetical protein
MDKQYLTIMIGCKCQSSVISVPISPSGPGYMDCLAHFTIIYPDLPCRIEICSKLFVQIQKLEYEF